MLQPKETGHLDQISNPYGHGAARTASEMLKSLPHKLQLDPQDFPWDLTYKLQSPKGRRVDLFFLLEMQQGVILEAETPGGPLAREKCPCLLPSPSCAVPADGTDTDQDQGVRMSLANWKYTGVHSLTPHEDIPTVMCLGEKQMKAKHPEPSQHAQAAPTLPRNDIPKHICPMFFFSILQSEKYYPRPLAGSTAL